MTTTSLALLNVAPGQVVQTDLDLEALLEADPEEPPYLEYDGDGLVRRKMSPTTDHGAIAAHLCGLFDHWQRQTGRRLYVYVEPRTISGRLARLPDVSVYRARPPENARKHALRVADVSIEIRSPHESLLHQRAKCRWYLEQGARAAFERARLVRRVQAPDIQTPCSRGHNWLLSEVVAHRSPERHTVAAQYPPSVKPAERSPDAPAV